MRILAWVSFSFAGAAAIGAFLDGGLWLLILGGLCLLLWAGSLFIKPGPGARRLFLALLGFGLGAVYFSCYSLHYVSPVRQITGQTVPLTVQVEERPVQTSAGLRLVGKTELNGVRCRVILYTNERPALEIGDRLTMEAVLRQPDSTLDQQRTYLSEDIAVVCVQKSEMVISTDGRDDFSLFPQRLAVKMQDTILELFSGDTAGFLCALLTGDRSMLSYQTSSDLSRSGISHMVAVSGMHIAVLQSMVLVLFGRRKLSLLLVWVTLPLFAAITGFHPSAMRAVIMQLMLLLAGSSHGDYDFPTALGLSLLINLLVNPWAIADVGLLLSYGAVIGINVISGPMIQSFSGSPEEETGGFLRKIRNGVLGALCTCFGALVFTVPLTILQFGMVSVVSMVSNLLVMLAVTPCFCFGMAAVLLGAVWKPLGLVPAVPAALLADYLLWVARAIASWPWAAAYSGSPYLVLCLLYGYGVLAVCLILRLRKLVIPTVCFSLLAMVCLLFSALSPHSRVPGITAVDVGQGACILLDTGSFTAMVDCGGSRDDTAGETAARFLENRHISRLDALILTHYDRDHVGGTRQLFHRVDVGVLLLPDVEDDSGTRASIEADAAEREIPIIYVTEDFRLVGQDGVLQVFAPLRQQGGNNASLTVLAQIGSMTGLVTGDLDMNAEYDLLSKLADVDLDVLVAGHHGSRTSTSSTFLEKLDPEAVLISVGENTYGHPAPETLDRINQAGAVSFRTDQLGSVTITKQGRIVYGKKGSGAQFWISDAEE